MTPEQLFSVAQAAFAQGLFDQVERMCDGVARLAQSDPERHRPVLAESERLRERLPAARAAAPDFPVVILGDSLSLPRPQYNRLYDAVTSPLLLTKLDQTYPQLLHDRLQARLPRKRVRVANLSRPGATVTEIRPLFHLGFLYHNPALVILHFGIVDCWIHEGEPRQRTPIDQFAAELKQIFLQRQDMCPSKPVLVVGILPPDPVTDQRHPGLRQAVSDYNDVLSSFAGEDVVYLAPDGLPGALPLEEIVHRDGHHLTTAGHQVLADAMVASALAVAQKRHGVAADEMSMDGPAPGAEGAGSTLPDSVAAPAVTGAQLLGAALAQTEERVASMLAGFESRVVAQVALRGDVVDSAAAPAAMSGQRLGAALAQTEERVASMLAGTEERVAAMLAGFELRVGALVAARGDALMQELRWLEERAEAARQDMETGFARLHQQMGEQGEAAASDSARTIAEVRNLFADLVVRVEAERCILIRAYEKVRGPRGNKVPQ